MVCLQCSAPGQQSSLAVANEEGFVTIFNTGEKQSSVLKGWFIYLDSRQATYVKHSIACILIRETFVLQSGRHTIMLFLISPGFLVQTAW